MKIIVLVDKILDELGGEVLDSEEVPVEFDNAEMSEGYTRMKIDGNTYTVPRNALEAALLSF